MEAQRSLRRHQLVAWPSRSRAQGLRSRFDGGVFPNLERNTQSPRNHKGFNESDIQTLSRSSTIVMCAVSFLLPFLSVFSLTRVPIDSNCALKWHTTVTIIWRTCGRR